MACGCMKNKTWEYEEPGGQVTTRLTETQARALYIRNGEVGEARPMATISV